MWLYIEDYLSKATSRYLPWAYRRLPSWSHPDFCCNPGQVLLQQDVNQFDVASLGYSDRRKILQAFLRYELLCKIYGPIAGKSDTQLGREVDRGRRFGRDPFDGYMLDQRDPFLYWDWYILYMYERRVPGETELQLLPCVREYVLAMYGALISDQVRAWLPVPGEHPEYVNAEFPDRSPSNEPADFQRIGGPTWSDRVVSLMATTGFDLLTTTLSFSSGEFFTFLVMFNQEIHQRPPLYDVTNVYLPITTPSRRRRISWHCNDYIRLNRQRAWPLFGGPHQYPRIPSVDEYERVYGPAHMANLVGWGLQADRTRNELIAHGQGRMAYSSLISKLVPFWE